MTSEEAVSTGFTVLLLIRSSGKRIRLSDIIISRLPTGSIFEPAFGSSAGIERSASSVSTIPMGMLIKKILPHPKADASNPPSDAPAQEAAATVIDVTLNAFPRFSWSTAEIARVANVSIGSLYSYFRDKDAILIEILGQYNEPFMKIHKSLNLDIDHYRTDPRAWFRRFMEGLIEVHKTSKKLNQELQILCHSMPEVAVVMEKQHEKIRQVSLNYIINYKDMLRVKDLEAAAIVVNNLISSVVDQIVFRKNPIDDERILNAGVDAVYQYLIG